MSKREPIRMCIACRQRASQHTLIRLKHKETDIVSYDGSGRSFYLCNICAQDKKKKKGLAKRFKINEADVDKLLKEIDG
ncbi:MAG: DUF448 domain-containing protein [Sulfurovaceae bacterium]|nr:DUF448 domain-containing protein [Sulfurovaceae bacterium]